MPFDLVHRSVVPVSGFWYNSRYSDLRQTPQLESSMKVTVHNILVKCPKHGDVPCTASSDFSDVVTMYCPRCETEAREQYKHPSSPYPVQGTSPSIIAACNRGD